MKVIDRWVITTECGTRTYVKYFFDTKHTVKQFTDETIFEYRGPKNNKTNNYDTVIKCQKAISKWYEEN